LFIGKMATINSSPADSVHKGWWSSPGQPNIFSELKSYEGPRTPRMLASTKRSKIVTAAREHLLEDVCRNTADTQ
jgi:hypothetical protein